ncbi:MAG: hypothetical protein UW60_C0054G0003 [Candidatus Woesebacteria bacterium GW2011_GWA2_44_33]|uniref:Uncharacterized protein n=1 Tax=Candidatus Woesebacteria bacterium GW2011_GWA2_44_33 TaxID=1618564 RepID=A0A0G1IZ63_9BACT|nr:MAG: hypothetical protein UW60_C0054G0003 [Candidatus Woesebacteria bacterium GW2011_GWA2_44_33]
MSADLIRVWYLYPALMRRIRWIEISSGREPIYLSFVVILTFLAAIFRSISRPVKRVAMMFGSPRLAKGMTFDFPGSSIKLKVWFDRSEVLS